MVKIPCSVSLITLNSAEGLGVCLESLKDFAEIIVCDGNSTDATRDIAVSFGAKVMRQYDTDEENTPCAMDKAAVRERAMSASTLPWRFFMDSDDGLSPEVVEEIRAITSDPHPRHMVWRMPTRIFMGGDTLMQAREIKREASYPAYQTRLVHQDVGAHFKGPVHDRLEFDQKKFTVGTMQNFYNFHWSADRVKNYWPYLHAYADRELATMQFGSLGSYVRWGLYFRMRVLLGYLLWRLPRMYLGYGFRDSMPLSIELTIVRYHWYLLIHGFSLFLSTRRWSVILVETLRGKDINRILGNLVIRDKEAYGRVLDIGGREGKSSYWRYLRHTRWFRITTLDIDASAKPDVVLDIENQPMPFAGEHFDTALLFNVLEHLRDGDAVLVKIATILRPGGKLIGIVPFLVGVHPDPHDFIRYTDEGLHEALLRAGFSDISIQLVGRGPLAASYYQSEFLWPSVLKLLIIPVVFFLDAVLLRLRPPLRSKFPLSYAFVATR